MENNKAIQSVVEIAEFYRNINREQKLYVGIEWERSGVYKDTLEPVPYEGANGYLAVLKKLVSEVGWQIVEGNRNSIGELQRGNARITLESDGRPELSGSPNLNLFDLMREFRLHANEVKEMGDFFNIGWIPIGWQPFHDVKDIPLSDKSRYRILKSFYEHDEMFLDYLQKCNGIHCNFSFIDEENAIIKAQTAFRITPIVVAIFSSSPINKGEFSGYLNYRRRVIKDFDPARNELPKNILSENFSLEEWIDWYIKKPVYYFRRGKKEIIPRGYSFADWMQKGFEGYFPTLEDFDFHVKSVWSDIRLRPSYLEYRVLDSLPLWIIQSSPALIKGLMFDSENWQAIKEMTKDWTYEEILEADRRVWQHGLKTEIKGRPILHYAKELIELATQSLHRFGRKNGLKEENDESVLLAPLKEQIFIKEKNLAEELADLWEKEWNKDPRRLLEWCEREK